MKSICKSVVIETTYLFKMLYHYYKNGMTNMPTFMSRLTTLTQLHLGEQLKGKVSLKISKIIFTYVLFHINCSVCIRCQKEPSCISTECSSTARNPNAVMNSNHEN